MKTKNLCYTIGKLEFERLVEVVVDRGGILTDGQFSFRGVVGKYKYIEEMEALVIEISLCPDKDKILLIDGLLRCFLESA